MRIAIVCVVLLGCAPSTVVIDDAGHDAAPARDVSVAPDVFVAVDAGTDAPSSSTAPTLGAHALAFHRFRASSPTSIATPAIATSASGSTIVVSIGRGDVAQFALPTDSAGNAPYVQLDATHTYHYWPTSGTAVYAFENAIGASDFQIDALTPADDEITVAMVEVAHGAHVEDVAWDLALNDPSTSASVTTTGPATLVAFWWGEADGSVANTASPDGGFTVIDSVLEQGSLVQCAVATRDVDAAGTYDVTWTATPDQGAQLWLVAVR